MNRPRKLVVAALVADQEGRILLTERRLDQPMGGKWELPGGKIEPGEPPEVALRREIAEELGVDCAVERIDEVVHFAYPGFDLLMLVYRCRLLGVPEAREVAALAWLTPAAALAKDLLPADRPYLQRLEEARLAALP